MFCKAWQFSRDEGNHLPGVDILKKSHNAAVRIFCDAISLFDRNMPCQAGEGRELEPGFQQPGIAAISVNEGQGCVSFFLLKGSGIY
jgi:hypothetical protein